MSDTSQGPGWWLASDGRWYPPETWTGPPSQAPQVPQTPENTDVRSTPQAAASSDVPTYPSYPSYGTPSYGTPSYGTPSYGTPTYGATPHWQQGSPQPSTNGFAIASLVCSCAGPFLLGIGCILGIVFGFVARSQIRQSNGSQGGSGLALAGIIVGFSLMVLFVMAVILIAVFATNVTDCNGSFSSCSVN
jgi:hypothetical protein